MVPNTADIISGIESQGFCIVPNFVSPETLQRFMPEVHRRFDRQSFNGTIGYIRFDKQKYLQNTLAVHADSLKLYLHVCLGVLSDSLCTAMKNSGLYREAGGVTR